MKTYRWRGHFEGDPTPYRTDAEVSAWKKKDPIARFEKVLLERGVLSEKDMKEIQAEQQTIVNKAQEFAEKSPYPPVSEVYTDVYYHDEGGAR